MNLRFEALPTAAVRALQNGSVDSYGLEPERRTSHGKRVHCRHCLKNIEEGQPYLVLAYRPFTSVQPYAEIGPIFLCANPCERAIPGNELPEILDSPQYIVRGYDQRERIVYGTGGVVSTTDIPWMAERILGDDRVAFVHVRSTQNNCYQCRIERDSN